MIIITIFITSFTIIIIITILLIFIQWGWISIGTSSFFQSSPVADVILYVQQIQ